MPRGSRLKKSFTNAFASVAEIGSRLTEGASPSAPPKTFNVLSVRSILRVQAPSDKALPTMPRTREQEAHMSRRLDYHERVRLQHVCRDEDRKRQNEIEQHQAQVMARRRTDRDLLSSQRAAANISAQDVEEWSRSIAATRRSSRMRTTIGMRSAVPGVSPIYGSDSSAIRAALGHPKVCPECKVPLTGHQSVGRGSVTGTCSTFGRFESKPVTALMTPCPSSRGECKAPAPSSDQGVRGGQEKELPPVPSTGYVPSGTANPGSPPLVSPAPQMLPPPSLRNSNSVPRTHGSTPTQNGLSRSPFARDRTCELLRRVDDLRIKMEALREPAKDIYIGVREVLETHGLVENVPTAYDLNCHTGSPSLTVADLPPLEDLDISEADDLLDHDDEEDRESWEMDSTSDADSEYDMPPIVQVVGNIASQIARSLGLQNKTQAKASSEAGAAKKAKSSVLQSEERTRYQGFNLRAAALGYFDALTESQFDPEDCL